MAGFKLTKRVGAPPERVFAIYTDLANAEERLSGVTRLEMLTDGPVREGTRFRETRIVFKREATEEMEITRFDPGRGYSVEADSCGAHYRTDFRFSPDGDGTRVDVEFTSKPVTFAAKLMSPLGALMKGPMIKLFERDLDDLNAHAERSA